MLLTIWGYSNGVYAGSLIPGGSDPVRRASVGPFSLCSVAAASMPGIGEHGNLAMEAYPFGRLDGATDLCSTPRVGRPQDCR